MSRIIALAIVALTLLPGHAGAADLVRGVRFKISAGDLATGIAQVEDYKRTAGIDTEYLDAIGWLARGALLLGQPETARAYIAELRREIPRETPERLVPYGAAIEVEGRLIAASEGRGAAIRYLEEQLRLAKAPALRSRISKNINLLSLEGAPAPEIDATDFAASRPPSLASLRGKPILLFFFAEWCGDCKAQAPSLARVWEKYRDKGVALIAVTRLYGGSTDKPLTPADEKAQVERVWKDVYTGLQDVPITISTEAMVRYGVSATPTFAIIDRNGVVQLYTPTRVSEAELSRKLDEVLAVHAKVRP